MACTSVTVLVPVPKLMGGCAEMQNRTRKSAGSNRWDSLENERPFLTVFGGNNRGPASEPCGLIEHQTVAEPPDANRRWQTLGYGFVDRSGRLQLDFNSAVNKMDHYFSHQTWLTVVHFLLASLHPPLPPSAPPPNPVPLLQPPSHLPVMLPSHWRDVASSAPLSLSPVGDVWCFDGLWPLSPLPPLTCRTRRQQSAALHFQLWICMCLPAIILTIGFWKSTLVPNVRHAHLISEWMKTLLDWELTDSDVQVCTI